MPPADFRERCRALADSPDAGGGAVAKLAGYALDENQLRVLAAAIGKIWAAGRSLAPLAPFKLGVVGKLEPIVPALVASAPRHGVALECVRADFGQSLQEAWSADSPMNRAKPDAILLALDHRALPLGRDPRGAQAVSSVSDAVAFVRSMRSGFRRNSGALCIVQTLAAPPESLFGSCECAVPGTLRSLITAFNAELAESIRDTGDLVFDVASLAQTVGSANWHSPVQWNLGKFAFDARFLPLYADHVARLLGALRGRSRRCLIIDLDNTIWGGVIGDDGLERIVIGQGDATGEAYLEVQRTALGLRDRGVVLAVSSRNDSDIARAAFAGHPEMLLRENHIAVFQANWNDKARNIAAIASELSMGLDAMVFLDDNPVERGFIREALPDVAVPELPADPSLYARTLLAAGYFEAITFSEEDRKRAHFYEENAQRVTLAGEAGDFERYLTSLKTRIAFRPFDAIGRSRITQLINKSNQFNLATKRYTDAEVAQFESDPACFTLQVRLSDVFGDNGMISVVICRPRSPLEWEIDTWLMSCRVLGRGVERIVLQEILHHARAKGVRRLTGRYVPTDRNAVVRDHYANLGFRLVAEDPNCGTTWELQTDSIVEAPPMEVDRSGFEPALA